jgi:hypothetical protein
MAAGRRLLLQPQEKISGAVARSLALHHATKLTANSECPEEYGNRKIKTARRRLIDPRSFISMFDHRFRKGYSTNFL